MPIGIMLKVQDPPAGGHFRQVCAEAIQAAEAADRAGVGYCFVQEHHFSPDDYLPSPLVLCAAIAARTERIGVGTLIMQLPLYHPLKVAEDGAVIDNLSGGRLVLAFGLGLVPREFAPFGINIKQAVSRYEEGLEIIRRAWTEDRFSFAGKRFAFEDVSVRPRPIQQPHPPLWVGTSAPPSLERAGRLGYPAVIGAMFNLEVARRQVALYRDAARAHGHEPRVILQRNGWVARSRAEVVDVWAPFIQDHYWRYRTQLQRLSEYPWEPALAEAADREAFTYERLRADRLFTGTPEDVIAAAERWQRELGGFEHLVLRLRTPYGPDQAATLQAIELLGREVVPAL